MLVSPKSLQYAVDYVFPSYSSLPFCYCFPYIPLAYGWQLFSGIFCTLYFHFNFLTSLFSLVGAFLVFLLTQLLPSYLAHLSIVLDAAICTVST